MNNIPLQGLTRRDSLAVKTGQALLLLEAAVRDHAPVVFANSLGAEDMVLTDLIAKHHPEIAMFSLDTGRLPQETYDLMQEVRGHYSLPLRIYFPESSEVEACVAEQGINGFYFGVEQRKRCCHVRKVAPLTRALAGKGAWITGMRREQATSRTGLEAVSFDEGNGLYKYNPLLEWSSEEVWEYIRSHKVPYNVLHDNFYPSIGCAPCTRSVTLGEDIRAGRWWWEQEGGKECGLHASPVPLKRGGSITF